MHIHVHISHRCKKGEVALAQAMSGVEKFVTLGKVAAFAANITAGLRGL